jgi:ligand-binding SRPBCC domain-containing protein
VNIYEKTSLIECQVQELFDFHLDTNNLKVISPKNIKVTLLNEGFMPKEGAVLKLRTVKNFIPIIWEVKIDTLNAPNLLVDIALKSPFKSWKHSHVFTQIDENLCELKDVVEYSLPFGFVGSLFNFFIHNELKSMFEFRHTITKQVLEDDK